MRYGPALEVESGYDSRVGSICVGSSHRSIKTKCEARNDQKLSILRSPMVPATKTKQFNDRIAKSSASHEFQSNAYKLTWSPLDSDALIGCLTARRRRPQYDRSVGHQPIPKGFSASAYSD